MIHGLLGFSSPSGGDQFISKGMLKNHKLARAITNASWSKLVSILQYKCDWYGKKLIQVNPAYTSQICINCGKNNHRLGSDKGCSSNQVDGGSS